jgi:hypothetical protein
VNDAGIFVFGVVVFAVVAAACGLIVYGIVAERRERKGLEAEQGHPLEGETVVTSHQGDTRALRASR